MAANRPKASQKPPAGPDRAGRCKGGQGATGAAQDRQQAAGGSSQVLSGSQGLCLGGGS